MTRCPAKQCSSPTQLVSPEAQYPAASARQSPVRSALSLAQMLPGGPEYQPAVASAQQPHATTAAG